MARQKEIFCITYGDGVTKIRRETRETSATEAIKTIREMIAKGEKRISLEIKSYEKTPVAL